MIRIGPRLKRYAWGQTNTIPDLLGLAADGNPVAEAWFGDHESSPSPLADGTDLASLIAADPAATVGAERLPYLLKILAIAAPLSIQVHPNADQARVGFDAEDLAGVDLAAPDRTFRDPRHKPELVVALTPMRLLVGLRTARELVADLREIGAEDLVPLAEDHESLLTYVMAVLDGHVRPEVLDTLASVPHDDTARGLAGHAARAFPGDPGALVALAMNPVVLQPGEGCYVAPRIIHSYQSGVGVEIMASSDNVVRGGLTPKAIDVEKLEALLDATPSAATAPRVRTEGPKTTYAVPVDDFSLIRLDGGSCELSRAPRIVLAMDETEVTTASGMDTLRGGEAAFLPLSDGVVTLRTQGTAFIAQPGGTLTR